MPAKVLRPIDKLFGQRYQTGEMVPDEVIQKMSRQVLQSLVSNGSLDVPGMEGVGDNSGVLAHLKAKMEKLEEQHKKLVSSNAVLQQANDDMAARVAALEASVAGGAGKLASKRDARKATQE